MHHGGQYQYILHVGVGRNGYIAFEKYAASGGYYRQDISGIQGPLTGNETFCTRLDVDTLEAQLQAMGYKVSLSFLNRKYNILVCYCVR